MRASKMYAIIRYIISFLISKCVRFVINELNRKFVKDCEYLQDSIELLKKKKNN